MAVCPISPFIAVFSATKLSTGTEVAVLHEHLRGFTLVLGESQVFPCHWARQCPVMAPSLNLTGEEKFETIFIPVISGSVSKRLVHAVGTVKTESVPVWPNLTNK